MANENGRANISQQLREEQGQILDFGKNRECGYEYVKY